MTVLSSQLPELTWHCLDAEPSDHNVKMDFNGSHRVARSLTGYITDQSSTPGVSAGSQTVQESHNKASAHACTHTRTHKWGVF